MTKNELQVIKKMENTLYHEVKEFEKMYGNESETYKRKLAKWSSIYELVQDLGIENKILGI